MHEDKSNKRNGKEAIVPEHLGEDAVLTDPEVSILTYRFHVETYLLQQPFLVSFYTICVTCKQLV